MVSSCGWHRISVEQVQDRAVGGLAALTGLVLRQAAHRRVVGELVHGQPVDRRNVDQHDRQDRCRSRVAESRNSELPDWLFTVGSLPYFWSPLVSSTPSRLRGGDRQGVDRPGSLAAGRGVRGQEQRTAPASPLGQRLSTSDWPLAARSRRSDSACTSRRSGEVQAEPLGIVADAADDHLRGIDAAGPSRRGRAWLLEQRPAARRRRCRPSVI